MKKTSFVLIIFLSLIIISGCTAKNTDAETTQPASSSAAITEPTSTASDTEAETTAPEDDVFSIETPFAVLKYPAKWKNKAEISVADDKVSFSANDTPLFDLLVNSDDGFVMGTLVGEEENVHINVLDYDVEDDELVEMQEDVNVILQNLMEDYDFQPGVKAEREDNSTFDIETPVVTMKYPSKWHDRVTVDVRDGGVYFSCDGTQLFDLIFSECDGFLLGTYNGTPIYVVDYDVEDDELAEMQEDVNVILQHLMEDNAFTVHIG